jgi:tetratricopeptide (TPR) repeat protein
MIKQQNGPGGAAASPGLSRSRTVTDELSLEEYRRKLDASLVQYGLDQNGGPIEPEPDDPRSQQSFWNRLAFGIDGTNRIKEIARSVPRGLAQAGDAVVETGIEVGGWLLRKTGLGEVLHEGFNEEFDRDSMLGSEGAVSEEELTMTYGKRSDDPLAAFVESGTQFAAGMALFRAGGLRNIIGLGAATDAAAFNPYEASLSELAAKAPVSIVNDVGRLLSVEEDDGAIVSRMKRATEGLVAGGVMDAIVWGARKLRAGKKLVDPKATPEEIARAQATVAQADEILEDIVAGKHVPEGAHVAATQEVDGAWTVKVVDDSPIVQELDETIEKSVDDPAVKQEGEAGVKPEGTPEAKPEEPKVGTPRFSDRAEAEQFATSVNMAINARLEARAGFTPEMAARHRELAKRLISAKNYDEAVAALDEADVFPSYYASAKEQQGQIYGIFTQMKEAIEEARANGQAIEESFKRARRVLAGGSESRMPALLQKKLKAVEDIHIYELAAEMHQAAMGKKLAQLSDAIDARPHDYVLEAEARIALDNYFELAESLAGVSSELGRALRIRRELGNPLMDKFKYADGDKPVAAATNGAKPKKSKTSATDDVANAPPKVTAGMTHRQIAGMLRMVKLAGGQPKNIYALAHAATVIKHTGRLDKAFEVFANGLLSGPKTLLTVSISGGSLTVFEPLVRTFAGVMSGNRALAREGADMLWALWKHKGENIQSAAKALKAGHSIINPQPQHVAIGGVTGQVVRVPGRLLGAADELTRVANYRAYVRAKSLRLGREQGLVGAALEQRVVDDLRNAFDPKTGIAMLPDALKYAETPTMSGALGYDTVGGGIQSLVNRFPALKFIAPFIRPGVHAFRYVWKATPGLNRMNKEVLASLRAGGEEAAIIHARSVVASSFYAFGLLSAMGGNLTGNGPADPTLRKQWLENNQPYSIKIGGKWISYRRADPLGMFLGLTADAATVALEVGESDELTAGDAVNSVFAALFHNLANKSYMTGVTQFLDAFSSDDAGATQRWLEGFSKAWVPQLVQQLNPDDLYRESDGFLQQIMSAVPGLSNNLPPKHNIFGEPVMKLPNMANRGVNPFPVKDEGDPELMRALLDLHKGLSPAPTKWEAGAIDLTSRDYDNGTGVVPYTRWMELVRNPTDGRKPLREAMLDLIRSDEWKNASDGTSTYPGGERWVLAASLKNEYEMEAREQLFAEYPLLERAYERVKELKGAALEGGEQGVAEVERLFGTDR